MTQQLWKVNEGNSLDIELVTEIDTTGKTITARYRAVDGSGTGTQFGTASGVSAGELIEMTLGTSALAVGVYDIEFYADYGGASQTLLKPSANYNLKLEVVGRFSV
jgi:hypothetical protein